MYFSKNATKIARPARPFAVVFHYATGEHERGEVLSTHKSYDLARKAAVRSGYDSFLAVRCLERVFLQELYQELRAASKQTP